MVSHWDAWVKRAYVAADHAVRKGEAYVASMPAGAQGGVNQTVQSSE